MLISYVASFSSRNAHIPQESLQVEGELGTVFNDSDYFEPPLLLSLRDAEQVVDLTADVPAAQREYQPQYDLADTRDPARTSARAVLDRRARRSPRRATTSGRSSCWPRAAAPCG